MLQYRSSAGAQQKKLKNKNKKNLRKKKDGKTLNVSKIEIKINDHYINTATFCFLN